MRLPLTTLTLLLCVAACSSQPSDAPAKPVASSAPATPPPPTPAPPTPTPGVAREVSVSNDLYEFAYAYPTAAAAIPALKRWLDKDLAEEQADLAKNAKEQQADRRKDGMSYNALSYSAKWQVVTELPGWLSLSEDVGTYEGGAHGNHGYDALLWDKGANVSRKPIDLFTSKEALSAAIRTEFCRQIDVQRAEKRGEPVKRGSDELFNDCIDPVESTVILGSSNRQAFDRIGVLVGPYAAGPYAEGDFEATVPVTQAVLNAVKPEYRASFAVKR